MSRKANYGLTTSNYVYALDFIQFHRDLLVLDNVGACHFHALGNKGVINVRRNVHV